MLNTKYETKGKWVQVPVKDFEEMKKKLERLDDIDDEAALTYALENIEEFFPIDVAKRIINGESPLRVYREYRGLTQQQLANTIGKSKTTISEIESGRKEGSVATLKAIARALDVDLDDLV